ncbi:MAG: hypothetical protein K8F58_15265 [Bauldia sp.]|nr:hypothetical protein [Bauldia sp.]
MLFQTDAGSDFYLELRNSNDPFFAVRRAHIRELWRQFKPFAESRFVDRFPQELGQRYWEMFVCCSLLDCGLEPCRAWAKRKNGAGPDFKVSLSSGQTLWVEAVTCQPGDPSTAKSPANVVPTGDRYNNNLRNEDDGGYVGGQHLRHLALRVSTVFDTKLKQAKKHVVDKKDSVVIAIGGGAIESVIWHDNLVDDLTLASCFAPFRNTNCIDLPEGLILEYQRDTKKAGASDPVTKPFEQNGAELIAGVLFSTRSIVSSSYQWGDELIWITNYRAARPFEATVFERHFRSILTRVDGNRLLIDSKPKAH